MYVQLSSMRAHDSLEKRRHQIVDHGASVSRLALKGSKRQPLTTPTIGRSTGPRHMPRGHPAPKLGSRPRARGLFNDP